MKIQKYPYLYVIKMNIPIISQQNQNMFEFTKRNFQEFIQFKYQVQGNQNSQFSGSFLPNPKGINRLEMGKWNSLAAKNYHGKISTWKTKKLWLNGNQNPQILNQIRGINFPSLQVLLLSNNNISSVEQLAKVELLSLEQLNISKNKIIEIKSLRKAFWPNLLRFVLNDNQITKFDSLSQMSNKKMSEILLQIITSSATGTINWICKLQSSCLEQIWIRSQNRIKNLTPRKIKPSRKNLQVYSLQKH